MALIRHRVDIFLKGGTLVMPEGKIIVYTSDDCHESKQIIHLLDELEVDYEERNISQNRAYLKELQAKSIYSAPVLMFNNKAILGFRQEKIIRLVKKNDLS